MLLYVYILQNNFIEFVFEKIILQKLTMNEKNIFHSQFKAKNAAIYAFFSGKIEKFLNLTVVKYLTYSMSVAGYVLHLSLQFWEMLFPSSHISNDQFKPSFKIYNSGCHRDFRRASRTRAEFSRKLQNVWVCIRAQSYLQVDRDLFYIS